MSDEEREARRRERIHRWNILGMTEWMVGRPLAAPEMVAERAALEREFEADRLWQRMYGDEGYRAMQEAQS